MDYIKTTIIQYIDHFSLHLRHYSIFSILRISVAMLIHFNLLKNNEFSGNHGKIGLYDR